MKKVFEIAAIILAVVACNKAELDNTPANNDGDGIPFRAKISATKALSEGVSGITTTWAVDEEVALIYNDGTPRKDVILVESVTAGAAVISGVLSGTPADNSDVTVIYPATAADGTTGNVLPDLLESAQVGTLADIASKYDVRKAAAKFHVDGSGATLNGPVSLTNQFAIFKFTVRGTDGTTVINVNPLVITINAVDYTITPASATDVLYVALPAIDAKAVSFTATDDSSVKYYCSKPSVTFAAGAYYQTTLKMSSQLGLTGQFSVSNTKKVVFSQGNLQWFYGENIHKTRVAGSAVINGSNNYNGGVFVFADHQWDICGTNNGGTDRASGNIESKINDFTTSKRIDLFAYGTSGYKYSSTYYLNRPFTICNGTYWSSSCAYGETDMAGTNSDWGVFNAILNGGDATNMWRTLTKNEWDYLINTRDGATDKRGFATVNGVRGLIILPDTWSGSAITPETNLMSATDNPPATVNWAANTYDGADWTTMEANGALFLPASGQVTEATGSAVSGHNVADNNAGVSYWTATRGGSSYKAYAFDLGYNAEIHWRFDNSSRGFARAVRLVRDVE